MAKTYIIWDITVPGITDPLRFSNTSYVPPEETYYYRASWTVQSVRRFMVSQMSHVISEDRNTGSTVVSAGGIADRKPTTLEVQNNKPRPGASDKRELDFLFTGGYKFVGSVVLCRAVSVKDDRIPTLAEFKTQFTGVLIEDPTRTTDGEIVSFNCSSRSGDMDGPVLSKRFNGMAGYWGWVNGKPPIYDGVDQPPMYGGSDWTLQMYYRLPSLTGAALFIAENGAAQPNIRLRNGGGGTLVLDIDFPLDTYVLHTLEANVWTFTTITFDATNSLLNVWKNEEHTLVDETILNNPSGVDGRILLGALGPIAGYDIASARIWSRILTDEEISPRLKWIEHRDETNLEAAWEMIERRDLTVTDFSGKRRHISMDVGTGWDSDPLHGENDQTDMIIPQVWGYGHGIPMILSDRRLYRAIASASALDIYHVYVKSMPIANGRVIGTGDLVIDGEAFYIDIPFGDFGIYTVQGQDVVITPLGDTLILRDQTPSPYSLPRETDAANITLLLEDSPYPPGPVTYPGQTLTITSGSEDWEILITDSPYYPASNNKLSYVGFLQTYPDTMFCDCYGDPTIEAFQPGPLPFSPPNTLANVIAQILYNYGPKWDTSIFPQPLYDPGNDYSVGAYVRQDTGRAETNTRTLVQNLLANCLTHLLEDEGGVFTLESFVFPESATGDNFISHDSVISAENLTANRTKPEALTVRYKKHYSPQNAKDVPDLVDADIKANVSNEFRTVSVGDLTVPTSRRPVFYTPEIRSGRAEQIGNTLLRLSQGDIWKVVFRIDVNNMDSSHLVNSKSSGDLTRFGMGDIDRVVLSRAIMPGVDQMIVWLWSENA
jgi:hypothetical protein